MATWTTNSGWEVTDKGVPLTRLGDKGYLFKCNGTLSLIEHRPGRLKNHEGHWRYFRNFGYAAILQEKGVLLSPRGKGEKTLTFDEALAGVGLNDSERSELKTLMSRRVT